MPVAICSTVNTICTGFEGWVTKTIPIGEGIAGKAVTNKVR